MTHFGLFCSFPQAGRKRRLLLLAGFRAWNRRDFVSPWVHLRRHWGVFDFFFGAGGIVTSVPSSELGRNHWHSGWQLRQ